MANIRPDLVLKRASNIKVFINSSTDTKILIKGLQVEGGMSALPVLDAFAYPVTVSQALELLQSRVAGAQDWINLTTTITKFYNFGILIDETQAAQISTSPYGFDSSLVQTIMLNDRARTDSFIRGIGEVVRPGDVVVDIGTGTGVLAVAAARAGARHVYAIEASGIGAAAKAIFRENGLADRITLIPGWSTQVNLPERADVMISETIGNEPLGESVLETVLDARARLLKSDARLVPGSLKIMGLPVTVPDAELTKRTFSASALSNWQSWYGIDFNPLQEMIESAPQTFYLRPQKAKNWASITDPVLLATVNFKTVNQTMINHTATTTAKVSGELNGLLLYFELAIGPNTVLSTHPREADEANHWLSLVWITSHPIHLREGDGVNVTYKYRVRGAQDIVQFTRS